MQHEDDLTAAPRGKALVLIVEDEPILRQLAADIVEAAGFSAVSANDANQALRLLECRADVTIVFTDVEIPGAMDGIALAKAIRDRWPPIHLLVTSGLTEIRMRDMPDSVRFFAKPYRPRDIIEELRRIAA